MKRKLWTSMTMGAALLAALAAHAGLDERRAIPQRQGEEGRLAPMQRHEQPATDRQVEPREPHHHGHMSPEERRQLRRDIDAAGRELYRPTFRPRRD